MKRILATAALAATILAAPAFAGVHQHDSHARGTPPISLDAGRKWATDEPLRRHMAAMRDDVAGYRTAIRTGSLTPQKSSELGVKLEQRVAAILTDCKLAPEADRNLHVVIAELVQAADALQGKSQEPRARGAARALHAMELYPRYFDHPGWRPVA